MEDGALNCEECFGTLTVNGILLNTPAWCVFDFTAALDSADLRGSDLVISHVVGVRPKRRRRTLTRKDFPMAITGLFDDAGVRQSDTAMGLIKNIETLKAGLGIGEDAPAGITGTVSAVWNRPDSSSKSADVHVISLKHSLWQSDPHVSIATLSLDVPRGMFT